MTELDRDFDKSVFEFICDQAAANPAEASLLGLTDWDGQLADMSAEAIQARQAADQHWLIRFQGFEAAQLSGGRPIDLELVVSRLSARVANADFEVWRQTPAPYIENGVFHLFVHRARVEADAVDAAISRLQQVPAKLDAARRNIDAAIAHPDILRRDVVTVRGQAKFLRGDVGAFVSDDGFRASLLQAAAPVAVAYDELAQEVEQLAERATGTFVFGERRYNTELQVAEQLSYDVHTLREMGQTEFEGLDRQMAQVAKRLTGSPDWKQAVEELQEQHSSGLEGMLQNYRQLLGRARQFVIDQDLMTVTATEDCDVEPAPAFSRAIAVASYFEAAPFISGTRGTFNVPYTQDGATERDIEERLRANAPFENASTTVHEAYPGHHVHFVHMANAGALRQFLTSTFFVEGWALYTEKMMYEQGFFESDAEILGFMAARIMRAGRIVVDTGLHLGEMSIAQAQTFMHERVGLPDSVAKAEALRYAAWPTQASAYLTGALAIEAMAKQWTGSGRGGLKQFHDALTDTGALPPGLAAQALGLSA